ncbi:MAG TPA: hemerythrin domain-containing protein [Thermoanaerobaculia bacterium]|nr:hemerythrin domain-containing protein [Thermoanaerobaculia bacterium]
MEGEQSRRRFLQATVALGAVGLAGGGPGRMSKPEKQKKGPAGKTGKADEEVSLAEDLMREHGVLKRVLLVYGESLRRLGAREELPPEALADSARIIRSFIEDYHEKLEEDFLFPRFRKANTLVDLVEVLLAQHRAGRRLTDTTLRLSTLKTIRDPNERKLLADSLKSFIRMYSPHEAREDTVLFPAFRKIVSGNEYDALGEQFEDKEHELFGADGFEKMVDRVAGIEKKLGIYDLAQFTPKP